MTHAVIRYLVLPIMLGLVLAAAAQAAEKKLDVDGMDVLHGIVPAEVVKKQGDKGSSAMHDGRGCKNVRRQSGQGLSAATIEAVVPPLGLAPQKKRRDPMRINETITYGNVFESSAGSA